MAAHPVLSDDRRVDTSTPAPDFEQISALLQTYGALLSAAELHGFLVGQLAAGSRFSRSEWLRAANEQADLSQNPDEVAGDRLQALHRHTLATLQNSELDFQLLLPGDASSLLDRVEALGQWCQGFLMGFGLGGRDTTDNAELAESLRDLAAIAQIGASEEDEATERSEADLFSICEYVRLAAIDIFWLHEAAAATPGAAPPAASPANLFQRNKLH
jgi:yecA family protein